MSFSLKQLVFLTENMTCKLRWHFVCSCFLTFVLATVLIFLYLQHCGHQLKPVETALTDGLAGCTVLAVWARLSDFSPNTVCSCNKMKPFRRLYITSYFPSCCFLLFLLVFVSVFIKLTQEQTVYKCTLYFTV